MVENGWLNSPWTWSFQKRGRKTHSHKSIDTTHQYQYYWFVLLTIRSNLLFHYDIDTTTNRWYIPNGFRLLLLTNAVSNYEFIEKEPLFSVLINVTCVPCALTLTHIVCVTNDSVNTRLNFVSFPFFFDRNLFFYLQTIDSFVISKRQKFKRVTCTMTKKKISKMKQGERERESAANVKQNRPLNRSSLNTHTTICKWAREMSEQNEKKNINNNMKNILNFFGLLLLSMRIQAIAMCNKWVSFVHSNNKRQCLLHVITDFSFLFFSFVFLASQ